MYSPSLISNNIRTPAEAADFSVKGSFPVSVKYLTPPGAAPFFQMGQNFEFEQVCPISSLI